MSPTVLGVEQLAQSIAARFADVLRDGPVSVDDNFFALGGHSLLAMTLAGQLGREWQADIGVARVLDHPTPRALAAWLLPRIGQREATATVAPAVPPDDTILSIGERSSWMLEHQASGTAAAQVPVLVHLRGALDAQRLLDALRTVVERDENFRVVFEVQDGLVRRRWLPAVPPGLNIGIAPGSVDAEQLTAAVNQFARLPFDLARGPLVRARLYRCVDTHHALLVVMHHIIIDEWALRRFFVAVSDTYCGVEAPVSEMHAAEASADVPQHDESTLRALAYWREQLADAASGVAIPADRRRPALPTHAGAVHRFHVGAQTLRQLRALAGARQASLFMVLMAAFQFLLHLASGQHDIVAGTAMLHRRDARRHARLGSFVNLLPLRTRGFGEGTFADLVDRVRASTIAALDHGDVGFDQIVAAVNPGRVASGTPLLGGLLVVREETLAPLALPGVSASTEVVDPGSARFDLTCTLEADDDGIAGWFEYGTDLFTAASMASLANAFVALLDNVAAKPEQPLAEIDAIDTGTRRWLLKTLNDTWQPLPQPALVHRLFESVAAQQPDAVALVDGEHSMSYHALDEAANGIAHQLRAQGVRHGEAVGVALPRGRALIASLLGILKAGATYLPLDLSYPAAQLSFMLGDAAVRTVIGNDAAAFSGRDLALIEPSLIGRSDPVEPAANSGGEDAAYIMYTSGSTGQPKGVRVPHRAILRLVCSKPFVRFGPDRVFLALATPSFDASTFEIWGALLHGARCVIAPDVAPDLHALRTLLQRERVTTLWLTAALFNAIVNADVSALAGVEDVLTGGEALSVRHVRLALQALPGTRLHNGYGPTESTTFACTGEIARDLAADAASGPIGRPIGNTAVVVRDHRGRVAAPGMPGEILVGGDGLALGYLGQPALTAERFIANPFADLATSPTLYRTGDLGRVLADGRIEYLGRLDRQLKIRGFRIEPGEVESALLRLPGVAQAAVIARPDPRGDLVLAAYVVGAHPGVEPAALRSALAAELPAHLVPASVTLLAELPRNANQKIDRDALPPPTDAHPPLAAVDVADVTVQAMLDVWRDLFKDPQIGARDDFFALGGHSLLAVQLFSMVERRFGRTLPMGRLWTHPTAESLAGLITDSSRPLHPLAVPLSSHASGAPLFVIPGLGGHPVRFQPLVARLNAGRPVIGLAYPGYDGSETPANSIEDIAAELLKAIDTVHPSGPVHLLGYSLGGLVAFEIARALQHRPDRTGLLVMLDAYAPGAAVRHGTLRRTWAHAAQAIEEGTLREITGALRTRVMRWVDRRTPKLPWLHRWAVGSPSDAAQRIRHANWMAAGMRYRAGPLRGAICVLRCAKDRYNRRAELNGWNALVDGPIDMHLLSMPHTALFDAEGIDELSHVMTEVLQPLER
jgi:amino acid adenylation domain-containing protein